MKTMMFTLPTPVFVYRNLHANAWSVRALDGKHKGKVIMHASEVILNNAHFKVSEAGRQKAIKDSQKNVHAGVVGNMIRANCVTERLTITPQASWETFCNLSNHEDARLMPVTYNPYKTGSFVFRASDEPVDDTGLLVNLHNNMTVSVEPYYIATAA